MHTATNDVLRVVTGVFIKDKKPIIVDERRDRSVDLMIFDKRSSSATTPSPSEPSMPKFYPLDASHGPAMALLSAHLLLEPTPQQTSFPFHQYLQQQPQQQQQPQSMYYCTPMLPPMPSHTPQQHQQHPLVTPLYSQQPPPVLGYYPTPSPQSPLNQLPQLSTTPSSHTRRKPVRPLYQQQQHRDDERRDTRTSTPHHYQQQQQQQEPPPPRQHRIPRKQPQYLAPSSSNSNSSNNQSRRVRFANTLQVMTYDAEDEGEEEEDNLVWDDTQDDFYQQEEEEQRRRRRNNNNRVFGLYTPSARKRSYQYAPHSASYY